MPDPRLAAEREFLLDKILTALWKGKLTRAAATDGLMTELGMDRRTAQAEIDGFLRD